MIRKQIHKLVDQLPENRLNCSSRVLTKLLMDDKPTCLYHYTTPEGLLGILNTKTIWATQYSHLNDFTELLLAKKMAKERIKAQRLDVTLGPLDSDNEFYVSVFSLSTESDLLSQWRAYCPTGGYAIGFDFEKLRSLILKRGEKAPTGPNFLLGRCIYDKREQRDMIDKWLKNNAPSSGLVKMVKLDKFIQEVGLLIKHHGFKEEHEWRIISRIMSPIFNDTNRKYGVKWKVRGRNYSLIEYMEIDLSDEEFHPIREIIVGPCPDKKLAKRFVDRILKKSRMDGDVVVKMSDIPYRNG